LDEEWQKEMLALRVMIPVKETEDAGGRGADGLTRPKMLKNLPLGK
jgi:hypothetical protein